MYRCRFQSVVALTKTLFLKQLLKKSQHQQIATHEQGLSYSIPTCTYLQAAYDIHVLLYRALDYMLISVLVFFLFCHHEDRITTCIYIHACMFFVVVHACNNVCTICIYMYTHNILYVRYFTFATSLRLYRTSGLFLKRNPTSLETVSIWSSRDDMRP